MKIRKLSAQLAFVMALAASLAPSSAAVLSVAGNDTLVGNRPANLIANGSFEADGGVAVNYSYWATGTGFTPPMTLTGWIASGQPGSYAVWGSDGFGGTMLSDLLPHGTNGLYFGAGIMASVSPLPTEANDGQVTFSSTPVIVPKPTDGPVTLQQTVSGLNPSATYVLDFWTSGESVGPLGFVVDGFFGLDISGEATLYFAAPSGNGPIGNSQRYQVYFTPTASTVTFEWINWGHYTVTNGMSDELVLDDVFLNLVSNTPVPLDCNCLTNITVTCPATVPDLCAQFAHCFGTNMLPGSCTQNFPPGMQFPVGTYLLTLQVLDMQSNAYSCNVSFTVYPPVPTTNLTVICPTNKTVECGPGWTFDPPVVLSSCCWATVTVTTNYSTGSCPTIWTRAWQIMDGCGNVQTCQQKVTEVDTTPPATQCSGANLVPNGNFESYTNCPSAISQFDFAAPWFTPTAGTSDYYNSCAGPGSFMSTPNALAGYQIPLSGQGYAGAVLYSTFGTNPTNSYREYLEVPLLAPLASGQQYLVSFYVSRAEQFGNAIADIGALLFPAPLVNYGSISNPFTGVLPFTPQIVNPSTNIITDTNNWTLIQGVYTAIGGESHLILGNFRDDPATTAVPASGPFINYAYYYFDDVSVVALCTPPTNKTVQCGAAWTFDEPLPFDNCSGGNVTVAVITTTNNVCPQTIERTWSLTDLCGNTTNLTQTVTLVDTNPPVVLCAPGANLVPNPQFESYSYCPWFFSQVPAAAPWFNPSVATPDYFNACTSFPFVSTPTNMGGSQSPWSGQAYAGAFVYSRYGTNPPPGYREYLETPLLAPLVAGMTYQVSFRVNLADYSGWAVAEIGAHLSSGQVVSNSSQAVMNLIPQVVNPSTNLLTSTNSWTLVQGTFTAVGGEDHITLGNFRSDALTTAVLHLGSNSPSPSFVDYAYYYYEDVSVVALCPSSATNKIVACGQLWSFDPPLGFDLCSGTNVTVTVLSTITNTNSCPVGITRTWLLTDACSNAVTWSQTVQVADTNPPVIMVCAPTNLVPNWQFENYTLCPTGLDLAGNAAPWYLPTTGTADYFNTCALPASFVSVPTNFVGDQMPYSGQGYVGAYAYSLVWDYREYLQVPLLSPLVGGTTYTVSFRVSLADNSGWAVANLGAHFSNGPLLAGNDAPLNVVPQVANAATNLLASSNAWMLVQGSFTAAGGETHLTLGNFLADSNTTVTPAGGFEAALSYYFFDDVQVIPACIPSTNLAVEKVFPCGSPWEFDLVTAEDVCSGTNITTSITTVTNSLCPFQATRTWTFTDSCSNSTVVAQMVIVTDNIPPVVNCACLLDAALPVLSTNACAAVIPDLSFLTNSPCMSDNCGPIQIFQSPAAGTPVGPGAHSINVTIADCGGNGVSCPMTFQAVGPTPTITCPPNLVLTTCTNFAIANFAATATGHTGNIVYSPPSGSAFPINTSTLVTCTVTNSCGASASCTFTVTVKPPHLKFPCISRVIGIITYPPPTGRIIYLPDFPSGGLGVDFADLDGTDGVRFDLGPAEKFTFSTVLDFNAPEGAGFELRLPAGAGQPATTLLRFARASAPQSGWNITRPMAAAEDPGALYRSIAIGTNGELFSSFTQDAAALDTNILVHLAPMAGATNAQMTVTLDCLTREMILGFPSGTWMPDASRKGWDGCIYGNHPPRATKTNKTARVILTPLTTVPPATITEVGLVTSNLATLAFDNPSLTMSGRKWSDGHVTLMKAYDDGSESGMEFYSSGPGGGVNVELGHAASFQLRMTSLDTNGLPLLEQQFAIRGWPPGTTTNRPPPPVINLLLAPNVNIGGVDVGAEFVDWGVTHVTLQLWNGTTLVGETNGVPATLAGSLVTLAGFPGIIGCPGIGVVSLSDTNPIVVAGGLDCGTLGCVGTELRIIAEPSAPFTPPIAYTGLESLIGEEMDYLIHRLQTTPACAPLPLQVAPTSSGVVLSWAGDGFHLQGAETVNGPWYDLEVESPATIPAISTSRVFRLRCE